MEGDSNGVFGKGMINKKINIFLETSINHNNDHRIGIICGFLLAGLLLFSVTSIKDSLIDQPFIPEKSRLNLGL